MDIGEQVKLGFAGVDVISVHFDVKGARPKTLNVSFNCTPKVFYPDGDKSEFKIVMDLEVKDDQFFELTVQAVGNFRINKELTDDLKHAWVNGNAVAIMFPYLRAFVTTLTSSMGNVTGSIVMPAQFFRGELEEMDTL
jgi:preprotein translocase subunit SecB